jgi:hypothetical protein
MHWPGIMCARPCACVCTFHVHLVAACCSCKKVRILRSEATRRGALEQARRARAVAAKRLKRQAIRAARGLVSLTATTSAQAGRHGQEGEPPQRPTQRPPRRQCRRKGPRSVAQVKTLRTRLCPLLDGTFLGRGNHRPLEHQLGPALSPPPPSDQVFSQGPYLLVTSWPSVASCTTPSIRSAHRGPSSTPSTQRVPGRTKRGPPTRSLRSCAS